MYPKNLIFVDKPNHAGESILRIILLGVKRRGEYNGFLSHDNRLKYLSWLYVSGFLEDGILYHAVEPSKFNLSAIFKDTFDILPELVSGHKKSPGTGS